MKTMTYPLLLVLVILQLTFNTKGQIQVATPNGIVEGTELHSDRGISFYAFFQLPYAKPPVGELRFKSPQPAEKWDGVRNATFTDRICHQQDNSLKFPESEDCLYLNVYSPKIPSENNSLPVMFYIYGGGFVKGFANELLFGAHYLMEFDVIVVTINYRVGPFGFLSTGDLNIPGNYGLKDQLLALKWVQENIKSFGGDPSKVTIFGQSAGAAGVGFQLLSPKSNGLFRAAIAQSGSILCPWSYQENNRKIAYQLASLVDSNFNTSSTSEELLSFLLTVPSEQLNNASKLFPASYYDDQIVQGYLFTPCIEPEHEDAFITVRQYSSIKRGLMKRVPLMIGITFEEMLVEAPKRAGEWDANISTVVLDNMHITDESQKEIVGEALRSIYTNGTFTENLTYAINFLSDAEFGLPVITHAKLQSRYSDVYFYRFSYYGSFSGSRPYYEGAYRIIHGDDYYYIWSVLNRSNLNLYPVADILTSERYRTLFVNFATDLNPVSSNTELLGIDKWPKVTPCSFQYLDINETLTIQKDLKKDILKKWVKLYAKLAIKPYNTY